MQTKGVFIAFEGLDGSGKTTQMAALKDKLNKRKVKCREEREPSDGIVGLIARSAIKKKITLSTQAMALLFAADRYEHILNDIKPCIDSGIHVLTDRYLFSNFAYQGLECSFEDLYSYNKQAIALMMPDLTIFIDTDPQKSLTRIGDTRVSEDLYDREGVKVRNNFLETFERFKHLSKIIIIDGNQPTEAVTEEIWRAVEPLFVSGE